MKKLSKLHKQEEKLHHKAEKAMHQDEKVHEKIEKLSKKDPRKKPVVTLKKKAEKKIERVMHEFKTGALHSGSKKGPKVKSRSQALAIALSESRRVKKGKKK